MFAKYFIAIFNFLKYSEEQNRKIEGRLHNHCKKNVNNYNTYIFTLQNSENIRKTERKKFRKV